jgi:hypothetical protein
LEESDGPVAFSRLTDNTTQDIIEKNGLKQVRVETKYGFVDYLISVVLGFVTIRTRTMVVEGSTSTK